MRPSTSSAITPKDHPSYSTENERFWASLPIAEFVGLHPKMYSVLRSSGVEIRKVKGVQRVVMKNYLHLDEHIKMKHKQLSHS